jgi:predicted site-specific integrase-resolvase
VEEPSAPEELLTTGGTAKRLGLSRSTLWRYVKAGLIEPDLITAGGHYRFDPEHPASSAHFGSAETDRARTKARSSERSWRSLS